MMQMPIKGWGCTVQRCTVHEREGALPAANFSGFQNLESLGKTIPVLLCCMLCLLSCKPKDNRKETLARLVTEWQGKTVVFPDSPVFTRFATDTVDYRIPASGYKVLVYVDTIGCTSCRLQLLKWKEWIQTVDSVTGDAVPFLFFFYPKDLKNIRFMLERDGFDRPVCIDFQDKLNKQNRFPADMTFQTFLLDKDNKVVVIGNPVHNTSVKNLYLKQIMGEEPESSKPAQTTAKAESAEIDLGTFDKTEKRKAVFTIKNTGRDPLVIADVTTSCGCTSATYDKHPANPGETLRIEAEIHPENSGFFEEIITVMCNTENVIELIIKGQTQ
jgi:hypothetical protein